MSYHRPAPRPLLIGRTNCETMIGVTGRWLRDHAVALGLKIITIDSEQYAKCSHRVLPRPGARGAYSAQSSRACSSSYGVGSSQLTSCSRSRSSHPSLSRALPALTQNTADSRTPSLFAGSSQCSPTATRAQQGMESSSSSLPPPHPVEQKQTINRRNGARFRSFSIQSDASCSRKQRQQNVPAGYPLEVGCF